MADEKKSFPKIAPSNWFALRDKFKLRVPADVSTSYVASALNMEPNSARSNVIAPLKALGLVQDDGKPTDLAYDWRDDEKYKEVCESIVQNVYPQELQDLFHDKEVSPEKLTSWFMRSAKVGEPAAKMFARTYQMLIDADPSKNLENNTPKSNSKPTGEQAPRRAKPDKGKPESKQKQQRDESQNRGETGEFTPNLHIDIQVHIAPESSPELIDKIFESMAKHLRGFKS